MGGYKKVYCSWDISDWKADLRFWKKNPSDLVNFKNAKWTDRGWIIPK